ncbi:hypothetical protein [Desulfopila inferna]|nr:hypothetical protein [Desulfopila inferna]
MTEVPFFPAAGFARFGASQGGLAETFLKKVSTFPGNRPSLVNVR